MKERFCFAALLATTAAQVFAAGALSYEEFLERCKSDNSGQASKIKVLCVDEKLVWRPIESGLATLAQSRSLTAELSSDKFRVEAREYALEIADAEVSCPQQRQILELTVVEKPISCAQALNASRGLKDICRKAIEAEIALNPEAVERSFTGRVYNSCYQQGPGKADPEVAPFD